MKKGDSWRDCPNYERFWVEDTKFGHKITILFKDGSKDAWCCLKDPFAEENADWPINKDDDCNSTTCTHDHGHNHP